MSQTGDPQLPDFSPEDNGKSAGDAAESELCCPNTLGGTGPGAVPNDLPNDADDVLATSQELTHPDTAEIIRLLQDAVCGNEPVTRIFVDPLSQEPVQQELPLSHALTLPADSKVMQPQPALTGTGPLMPQLSTRFEAVRFLGRGGFGTVFLANDRFLGRQVAIKVPHVNVLQTKILRDRFLLESRASARLNHPNIVRVLDAGGSEESLWQVAEFVDGPSLKVYLRNLKERMPILLAAELIRSLADAVHHAHQEGVLHRDLKPDNILIEKRTTVDANGESTRLVPRLTDFGLARILDEETNLSRTGELIGTVRYMAPEQLSGRSSDIGEPTDIYSLGVILHELLTGQIPFPDHTTVVSRNVILTTPVPSLRILRSGLPRDLETICLKCLHVSPMRRYETAAELREDLSRFLDGRPTLARPLPWYEQFWLWTKRRPAVASSMAVIFVALTAFLIQSYLSQRAIQRRNAVLTETTEQLRKTTERLRSESERSESLLNVAQKNERMAGQRKAEFETLARQSTTQNALAALQRRDYLQTRALLEKLRTLNSSGRPLPEADLIQSELQIRYEVVYDTGFPIHEMVNVPGTSLVVIAGSSRQIIVFDSTTRTVEQTLDSGIDSVHAIAMSQDGELLAFGGSANEQQMTVPKLIRWRTGEVVREFPGQPATIETLAFSPDGKKLICGPRYEPMQVFDLVNSESPPVTIQTTRRNEWAVVRDSQVAILAERGRVTWNDLATGDVVRTIPFRDTGTDVIPVSGIDFLAVSRDNEYRTYVRHARSGITAGRLRNTEKNLQCLTGAPTQRFLYGGRIDGSLVRWPLPGNWVQPPPQLAGETSVEETPDAVDPDEQEVAVTFVGRIHRQPISTILVVNDSVLCASLDGTISSLPPKEMEGDRRQMPKKSIWHSVAIHPVGGQVWLGAINDGIETLQETRQKHLQDPSAPQPPAESDATANTATASKLPRQATIDCLTFSSDGLQVAWSDRAGSILVSSQPNSAEGKPIYTSPMLPWEGEHRALSFSNDGRWLAWADTENRLMLADCHHQFTVRTLELPHPATCLAFSPNNEQLIAGSSHSNLMIVDVAQLKVTQEMPGFEDCCTVRWTENGRSFLAGFVDGAVLRTDLSHLNRKESERTFVHRSRVVQILEIPGSELAVSVDSTTEVALWNQQTHEVLGMLWAPRILGDRDTTADPALRWLSDGFLILGWVDVAYGPQSRAWRLND